jgi:hypothetical protein
MPTIMRKLARQYIESLDKSFELREQMIELLVQTDAMHALDETGRRLALQRIQRDLYTAILAKQLSERPEFAGSPSSELVGEAELILDKERNPDLVERPPADTRTPDEERMYGALRDRWYQLTKAAGIRPMPKGPRR